MVDLLDLARVALFLWPGRARSAQGQLNLTAKRGQRRTQLVRERGAELAHFADGMLEAAKCLVEGARHSVQFIAGAPNRQPPIERVHVDLACRLSHPSERTQREL